MTVRWGELPVVGDTDSGIAAIEREQMTKPRPMEVEGPRLHQPSSRHHPPTSEHLPVDQFEVDSITLHTIKLIQHARKLRQLIVMVQQTLDNYKQDGDPPVFDVAPPIPEFKGSSPKHKFETPVPYLPREPETNFVKGISNRPPKLDSVGCHKALRKSVAAVTAHAGFNNCSDSVLETLTDITKEYILQMTTLLRHALDNEATHGTTGFQDVMEQVFHEMGIGSVTSLHQFYQTRIINYHKNLLHTSQQLMEEYACISNPNLRSDEHSTSRVKDEPLSDIQFPNMDESEEPLDPDNILELQGLGLEINIVQEPSGSLEKEEEHKWPTQPKPEPQETKLAALEMYEGDDGHSGTTDMTSPPHLMPPTTPGSESIPDPASVPSADIMSPPPSKPPKKKKVPTATLR